MNPQIIITGRIGQDPVALPNGGARLRVVTNDQVKNEETGKWEDRQTSWFTVKAWRKQAEQALAVLKKGQEVTIVGKIYEEHWVDKNTGQERSGYDIIAQSIAVGIYTLDKEQSEAPKAFIRVDEVPF
jgi:single-strand DNA-binding protein